jgi:hypothetical protein
MKDSLKKILKLLTAFSIVVIFSSCGVYTFNPKGKSSYTSIAIPRFENRTAEFDLAERLTDDIIDAFIADGTFKVLPEENAEVLLYGTMSRYSRLPYTFDENDQVQTYKVEIDFDIRLKNSKDDSDIWNEKMNKIASYDVESETEEDAREKVILLLIESIINKTTKNW